MFWELGCTCFEHLLFPYTQRWHLEEKEDRDVCLPMKNLFVSSGKMKQKEKNQCWL